MEVLEVKPIAKKKVRCSKMQIESLVDYMLMNPKLAIGEYNSLHDKSQEWEKLAETLNELGSFNKTVTAWARTWRELKKKARAERKQFLSKKNSAPVGDISMKVLQLLDYDSLWKRDRSESGLESPENSIRDSASSTKPSASNPTSSMQKPKDPLYLFHSDDDMDDTSTKLAVATYSASSHSPTPPSRSRPAKSHTPLLLPGSHPAPSRSPPPLSRSRSAMSRSLATPPRSEIGSRISTARSAISRSAKKLGPSGKVFAELQKQTNSLLQTLIDEIRNSNTLKETHNSLIHRQNLIMEENRSYRQAEKETQTPREIRNVTVITDPDSPKSKQIRVNKQKLLTKEQFQALMNNQQDGERYKIAEA